MAVRGTKSWCPRQDSNLRTRLRRPVLYPLSYEGPMGRGKIMKLMLPDPDPHAEHPPPLDHGPLPSRLLPDTATVNAAGRLSIARVDILDLCEDVGTPVFVYDEAHLRRRCREAVAAWGSGVAYA